MNFYDVLGVGREADRAEIRDAYRDLAQRYHPDVNEHPDASDQFKVLTKAREVLTDEEERNAYDRLSHANYVAIRIDGDLPNPEMAPRPEDAGVEAGGATARGGSTGGTATRGSSSGSTTGASSSTGGGAPAASSSSGSTSSTATDSRSKTGGAGTSSSTGRSTTSGSTTRGGSSTGTAGSSAGGGSSPGVRGGGGGATAGSTSTGGRDRSRSYSTPPTPGAVGSQTGVRGPERISRDKSRRAARKMGTLQETIEVHLAASNRWLGVVGASVLYFGGLTGYLAANETVFDQFRRDLTSPDPQRVARALGGGTYDVPDLYGFAFGTGDPAASVSVLGLLALLGALILPIALGVAVSGLRRRTTWRPSWMHLLGALGPATSIALDYGAGEPGLLPVASVPMIGHLLLLVAFPGLVVVSFLVNRLVVVLPLRRREDLGLP